DDPPLCRLSGRRHARRGLAAGRETGADRRSGPRGPLPGPFDQRILRALRRARAPRLARELHQEAAHDLHRPWRSRRAGGLRAESPRPRFRDGRPGMARDRRARVGTAPRYPLTALLAALRMKYFWKKITSRMIGTALNIAPASTQFQFTPNSPWNDASPSGSVRCSGERTTMSGHWNAFHDPWNCRIARAARAGYAFGRMICRNVRKVLAPSIEAASSSSFGSDLKNCVMKKTPNTSARSGSAIPGRLSTRPS